jgi:hypothetical protein
MPSIVRAIRPLGVPIAVVADFDVLRDANRLAVIVSALGANPSTFEKDRALVASALVDRQPTAPLLADVRDAVDGSLSRVDGTRLTRQSADDIKRAMKFTDGWDEAKRSGVDAITGEQQHAAVLRLIDSLKSVGLFVVPVGELESWSKQAGTNKTEWPAKALALDAHKDARVQSFVADITQHLEVPQRT